MGLSGPVSPVPTTILQVGRLKKGELEGGRGRESEVGEEREKLELHSRSQRLPFSWGPGQRIPGRKEEAVEEKIPWDQHECLTGVVVSIIVLRAESPLATDTQFCSLSTPF